MQQSSATVALRAFVMLACAVGIPVLAMSGASWSEILKKFQNLRWPAVVELASASTPAPAPTSLSDAPQSLPKSRAVEPKPFPTVPPALSVPPANAVDTAKTPAEFDGIPKRLQQLGATYYVLESWGNDQHLYRFYCKMAVAQNADYSHCFEATDADPRHAMQRVLRQVESWREATANGG
jgi:hypothetical protein